MFMEPEITSKQRWRQLDGGEGVFYFPADDFTKAEALEAYGYNGPDVECSIIWGYGARLSTRAANIDCTEWSVHPTLAAAAGDLLYILEDDQEPEPEDADTIIELERLAGQTEGE